MEVHIVPEARVTFSVLLLEGGRVRRRARRLAYGEAFDVAAAWRREYGATISVAPW